MPKVPNAVKTRLSVDSRMFEDPLDVWREAIEILKPPERLSVSDAASRYVYIAVPGGYHGPWDYRITPYMREPMDLVTSRRHRAVVFVGPAQSGKTQALVDCVIGYSIICNPCDMLLVDSSQSKANNFSRMRIDRMQQNSPEVRNRLSPYSSSDNIYHKHYKAGNMLFLAWPTDNQLRGKAIKLGIATDYDAMPLWLFDRLTKRSQTFLSGGMTIVDTSPGYDVIDPKQVIREPHEAPATLGGLAIYNDGDRRQFYWPCPACHEYFIPGPGLDRIYIPEGGNIFKRAKSARVVCPECGAEIDANQHKRELNLNGVWLRQGERITSAGERYGDPLESDIASFWLHGSCAGFQSLESLVLKWLKAERKWEQTGDEEALRETANLDQASAYKPRVEYTERSAMQFGDRLEAWPRGVVPEGVRFLVAGIDVQKDHFVVQVIGYGVKSERWLIDYTKLRLSPRGEDIAIDPGSYIEDWHVLRKHAIEKRYPCMGQDQYSMPIMGIICDSAGMPGVTERAYEFAKELRHERNDNFMLGKGSATRQAAKVRRSEANENKQTLKGKRFQSVALRLININTIKDIINADLMRNDPGPGYIHFADWLPPKYFEDLMREERDTKGNWKNPDKRGGNEPFDCFTYAHAAAIEIGLERIDWENPKQPWARPWDENPYLLQNATNPRKLVMSKQKDSDAVQKPKPRQRNWLQLDGGSWL